MEGEFGCFCEPCPSAVSCDDADFLVENNSSTWTSDGSLYKSTATLYEPIGLFWATYDNI
jgi:hypothetical protein